MKPPMSRVTLTLNWWDGDERAVVGDFFRTDTGRQYEVLEVRGKRIICRVLHDGTQLPDGAKLFRLQWDLRNKKR